MRYRHVSHDYNDDITVMAPRIRVLRHTALEHGHWACIWQVQPRGARSGGKWWYINPNGERFISRAAAHESFEPPGGGSSGGPAAPKRPNGGAAPSGAPSQKRPRHEASAADAPTDTAADALDETPRPWIQPAALVEVQMHEDGLRGSRYGAKVHRVGQARRAPSAPRRGTLRARPRQPARPSCPSPHPCSAPLPCSALCALSILCTTPLHPPLPLRRVTPLHPPHAARRTPPHAARRTPHAGAPCPAQSHALVEFEAFASEHSEEEKLQEWVRRPACRPACPAHSLTCPACHPACPACSPRPVVSKVRVEQLLPRPPPPPPGWWAGVQEGDTLELFHEDGWWEVRGGA